MEISRLWHLFQNSKGISTDSRKINPDTLFVALKGEKFNANEFASQALEKGAAYVIMDDRAYYDPLQERMILVNNSLETLQQLALYHRRQFKIPFIAVCGSNGKTTTKELIRAVLSKKYRTYATLGNLNNHIGVPLTLLSIPLDAEMAVIEMGANHLGETDFLCNIATPDYGLITNNGLDHLEGFGSIEGVKQANGELYDYLKAHGGHVFVNALEEDLKAMSEAIPHRSLYGNSPQPEYAYYAKEVPSESNGEMALSIETEKGEIVKTQLFGSYNFYNILTALCVGKYFGVPSEMANEAVANYIPANNRSQLIKKNKNTLILDAYNANPSSMQKALESLAKLKNTKKAVILGDMLELGDYSRQAHEDLGKLLAKERFDLVILYGEEMVAALPSLPDAYFFTDKFSLHNWLQDRKPENYTFLIKGSRGMALESTVEFIG